MYAVMWAEMTESQSLLYVITVLVYQQSIRTEFLKDFTELIKAEAKQQAVQVLVLP